MLKENPFTFWKYVNTLKNSRGTRENCVPEGTWITHVKAMYNVVAPDESQADSRASTVPIQSEAGPLTTQEKVTEYISQMERDGAPRPNGLPASVYKAAQEPWSRILASLFNIVT